MILLIAAFQQKLILPTLSVATAIGVAGYLMLWSIPIVEGIGFGYMLAGPLVHYYVYELRDRNEYYFYFNAGVDKVILYMSTAMINAAIGAVILSYA